jgi:effector-binding domain-containing protein
MEITVKKEQRTASVRFHTPVADISKGLGAAYGEIMQVLGREGLQPTGAPFAMYYNMDMADLDVEAGFPVAGAFKAAGRVKEGTIPGGRTAVEMHKGPYDTVEKAYSALTAFVQSKGASSAGPVYEVYLNDPQTTKPEELLTEVNFLLKD